ncbi:unnamed protein product [Prunus brigantina]
MVNPLTNTALGAELKHSFSTNDTALAVGARHAFLPSTLAKARVSTHGSVAVVIQQGFWQKIFMSISGEVDFVGMNHLEATFAGTANCYYHVLIIFGFVLVFMRSIVEKMNGKMYKIR